jgi:phosphate uptake regulator
MYPKYSCGVWKYSNGAKSAYSPEELIEINKKCRKEIIKLKREIDRLNAKLNSPLLAVMEG